VVVCGVVLVLTIVGFHAFLAQNQVRLDRIREDIAAAEARYDQARLENSELSSPERITAEAARQGLVVPEGAPVAVPVPGAVPKRGSSSAVIDNYAEVKGYLEASP
jgi:cell division protein FtsL